MKKYILLVCIMAIAVTISGCTNTTMNNNEIMNNQSIDSSENTIAKENSDLNKEETKELESSFQEKNDLKKPDIEEARDFDASLKNGSVITVKRSNSNELEVYNVSTLDEFIESFNDGKEGYVRVIKGTFKDDGTFLVNKLEEYQSDGKVIKDLVYDTYADKNKFIPGNPIYWSKIVKLCSDNAIRYSILQSKDTPENMGTNVISFYKSNMKN